MTEKELELLFTVGPVEMEESIIQASAFPLPYFRTEEFSEKVKTIGDLMKQVTHTKSSSEVVLLTASGTGAMEAALLNLFTTLDKVLIVNGGTFGQRFVQLCEILQIPYSSIKLPLGKTLTKGELDFYRNKGYTGLLINALETSTGVYYDLPMIGTFCKQENMLFVVDAIGSFLADPYFMDDWNIDVTIISSQKALSVAPGISIVLLNEKGRERIKRKNVPSLYFNFKNYFLDMKEGQTPFTPAIGVLLQLHQRLEKIREIGVPAINSRTRVLAEHFRERIKSLPFKILSESLSNTLTPLSPTHADAYQVYLYLKKNNIYVNPNGGELKSKLFRVGHIGNLTIEDNEKLIALLFEMERNGLL